jgi:6-pyruvoyl-tetrahydropterin synthase
MIAHSFEGEVFGPARNLHGATYVVDVEFKRSALDTDNLVIDIGLASAALKDILGELNYSNLDSIAEFKGQNTTTEFLAQVIYKRMAARVYDGRLGATATGLERIRVVLHESHVAWAAYEASLGEEVG